MTLSSLAALQAISFAQGDASDIEAAVIGAYERLTGLTLQPAKVFVAVFTDSSAYTGRFS